MNAYPLSIIKEQIYVVSQEDQLLTSLPGSGTSLLALQETTQWLWLSMPGNLMNVHFNEWNRMYFLPFPQMGQWDTKIAQCRDLLIIVCVNKTVLLGTVNQISDDNKDIRCEEYCLGGRIHGMQGLLNRVKRSCRVTLDNKKLYHLNHEHRLS